MATKLVFKRGSSDALAGLAKVDGQLIFTIDDGRIYLDLSETERVQMFKDIIEDTSMLKTEVAKLLGGKVDPETGDIVADEEVESIADKIAAAVALEKKRAEDAEKKLADAIGTASVPADGETAAVPATGLIADIEKNAADIKAIQDALGTGDGDDDASLTQQVAANKLAIDKLNGTGEGSVQKTVDDAINKFATDVSDDGVVNSYKELIDYVAAHGSAAADMVKDITDLQEIVGKEAVPGEDDENGTPATGLVKKVADNTAAIAAEVTRATTAEEANAAAITVLNGADTVEGSVAKKIKDALAGDSGLVWGDFGSMATGD